MHIHSSFSEETGSMDAQFFQAAQNAVDVCWFTEHDARLDGFQYRDTVHFTSLTAENGAAGQGRAWHWTQKKSGPLAASSGGGIVTTPCSPNDPITGGSLSLLAQATGSAPASFGFYANSQSADLNYRDNLTGQSLSIDVLLEPGWLNGYLELLIGTSYHEASAGRPAGNYSLSYQFMPAGIPGSTANGNQGIITQPVLADGQTWTTITITPSNDIANLWPDLDYRDFALWELTLAAVSTGDAVSGYFDYLNFDRANTGGEFFSQQQSMMQTLAAQYPGVTALQGLECSWKLPHINWYGAGITVPDYQGMRPANARGYAAYLSGTVIPAIQQSGGMFSYNHPFGTTGGPLWPAAQQSAALASAATALLPTAALGATLLEVGYPLRGHCSLQTHLGLWDVMSRNAVFLTGNGTSDDHYGSGWATGQHTDGNNWVTSAWAASTGMDDLLAAMASGQLWCGSLSEFPTSAGASLNLSVDGECPMGSASLSSLTSRTLTVYATGIPANGSLQVLQGAVDYAGTADPNPDTAVVASYSDTDLAAGGGQVSLMVDTTAESFVRTAVLDANGNTVAVSNPAWMLQNTPPNGIPAPRQA